MARADARRRGVALLDVLVAVTLLATAGLALVDHAAEASAALARHAEREREVRAASSELARLAALRPGALRAQVGVRQAGELSVEVHEAAPLRFLARVTSSSGALILATTLYPADGRMNVER